MLKNDLQKLSLANQSVLPDVQLPDNFYQALLQELLERDYLSNAPDMKFVNLYASAPGYTRKTRPRINWLQITRLPIHPNDSQSYDLLSRWQGVLTSLHAWGYRLYFLLLRHDGQTKLFMGTATTTQDVSAEQAVEQLREAAFGSMPGIGLRVLKNNKNKPEVSDEIHGPLGGMKHIGAVTGIPSFRESDQSAILQTLDQLAFGIRDVHGSEKDYAMLVIADPISDPEITDIISRHRSLSSEIHTAVKLTRNEGRSRGESYDPNEKEKAKAGVAGTAIGAGVGLLGSIVGVIGGIILGNPPAGANIGRAIAKTIAGAFNPATGALIGNNIAKSSTADMGRKITESVSSSINYEYLDKFAEYAEKVVDHHIERLQAGRNYGFWNTGIYVLGRMPQDVVTVSGMLRSVYSGEETHYEPIRLHQLGQTSNALDVVRDNFDLLPMLDGKTITPKEGFTYEKDQWHRFGKYYQYLSTPMNTKELGLATSLPRRDVPGLRFVKTAVRFANNPAEVGRDKITIGRIVDTGIEQCTTYDIDVNSLVRHVLVAGRTGTGKSTTCKRILREILLPSGGLKRNIPILIVEPAKDDYVRWALEMNKVLPPEKQFKIYMPGVKKFEGYRVEQLGINPFEPAHAKGAMVDILQHTETFSTLLNACLPSEDVVPILIEETVIKAIEDWCNSENVPFDDDLVPPLEKYPAMSFLSHKASEVMKNKHYEEKVKANLTEILETRIKSLRRGMRGKILNVERSTDYETLFNSNVVINISRLSGSKDKALIMSLLLQALYEYCVSCYANDSAYREKAQNNKLLHLTVIEEAHNVLRKPRDNKRSGSPEQAAADLFGNMLSEVRGYGQGFMIVDQVPTKLIDDTTKNTNYKIVHRLTAPDDQEVMASCMAFREDQKYIIPALETGNAIICGDEDDAAAWVKVPK